MIKLLSAADENLFVARRTRRKLVQDKRALQMEALLHAARVDALLKPHGMDFNIGKDQQATMEKIVRGKEIGHRDIGPAGLRAADRHPDAQ